MLATMLKLMPFAALLVMAESDQLESRQASAYGESSSYFQGCFSSPGGKVVSQGSDNYQSSGNCGPACAALGHPAFAVSGFFCYCTGLLPSLGDQVPDSACNTDCYGIDTETCGGSGVYSVYTNSLSGGSLPPRVGSGSSDSDEDNTSSTSSTSTKTTPKPRPTPTPTPHPRPRPHSHNHSSKQQQHHHKPASTSVSKTTVRNTVTAPSTSSPSSGAQNSSPSESDSSSSSSTGKTVGIVVGVIGGIAAFAAIIAAILFYLRRRRRLKNAENGHRRADSLNAFVASGAHIPGSLAGRMQTPSIAINDSRLDPWVMKETRRESGGSFLADSQDYSRRILKVTNPDSS